VLLTQKKTGENDL